MTESDPNGTAAGAPGAKLDHGKTQAGLLLAFGPALKKVAEVSTVGAIKYSRGGWTTVPNGAERYLDAAMRHWLDIHWDVVDNGPGGTNCLHIDQVIWNLLACRTLQIRADEVEVQGKRIMPPRGNWLRRCIKAINWPAGKRDAKG